MIFTPLSLPGAYQINLEKRKDLRGFFARAFCQDEFAAHGLKTSIVQSNLSYNREASTLRGMHYQLHPHSEAKLVTCIRGAVYDVIVDLRPDSPTFCRWQALELSESNGLMLYVPEGLAHGFQTLTADSTLFYQMFAMYHAESARGVRWDDPAFGILWPPASQRIISEKDLSYPAFNAETAAGEVK